MLYSGADLIRNSGQQLERLERLNTAAGDEVQRVEAPVRADDPPEGETQGALLRFARFIHKESEKKKRPAPSQVETTAGGSSGGDPYRDAEIHQQNLFERGQQLDVYV